VVSKRPLGVTLIALFLVLIGIIAFLSAAGMVFLATLSLEQILDLIEGEPSQWLIDNYPLVFGTIGSALLAEGVVALLLAYGFLKARTWAWMVGMVFALISIIIAFIQPWVIGFSDPAWVSELAWSLLWPWVLIIYLNRPKIKTYFGRVPH
jgi:hypothetical protein